MLDGVMLLWFLLTAAAVLYVAFDVSRTPESIVLKWAFVIITVFTGPIGAFLYVLGCREPLPGLHERYTAIRWRQALGSTMHCVAGDGIGILVGAVIGGALELMGAVDIALEYVLGFGFGWTVFQALFTKQSLGGSYRRALSKTFLPELLSMNALMAGMVPVMTLAMARVSGSHSPLTPSFWFIMSMALSTGFIVAFPVNWWLVSHKLKHGMMTVRPPLATALPSASRASPVHAAARGVPGDTAGGAHGDGLPDATHTEAAVTVASAGAKIRMTIYTFALFAVGLAIAVVAGGL